MALSSADIDGLAERIVHGAQERYTRELIAAVVRDFAQGLTRMRDAAALEKLARSLPTECDSLLAHYQNVIGQEVYAEVKETLSASLARDQAELLKAYGPKVAAEAGEYFSGNTTAHFSMQMNEAAEGLRKIIARQNVLMADNAEKAYYQAIGEATTAVTGGLMTMDAAMGRTISRLAERIPVVQYTRHGKKTVANRIDTVVRRHIVTQAAQAGGRMTLEAMESYGHTLVITDSHYGARPSHAEWQGLPCSTDGPCEIDGISYPDIYELTAYGEPGGLLGCNCRHSIHPYYPGITKLPDREFKAETQHFGMSSSEYYEATQKQRGMERNIRVTKSRINAMREGGMTVSDKDYAQARLLLGRQQSSLKDFCEDNGLAREYTREKAYGASEQPRRLTSARWAS